MQFIKKLIIFFRHMLRAMTKYQNWWVMIIDQFKLCNGSLFLYKLKNGLIFFCRAGKSDIVVVNEVFLDEEYTSQQMAIDIRPKDIVVDIGAFIGDFSIFSAHKLTSGKVYAFEPFSDNYDLLQKNVHINQLHNKINFFKYGIFSKNQTKSFYLNNVASASNSMFEKTAASSVIGKKIKIEVKNLEQFLGLKKVRKVDFLKLDCEGAEFDILYSLKKDFLKNIRCIVMEYHEFSTHIKRHNHQELMKYLRNLGFEVMTKPSFMHNNIGMIYCRNKTR